MSEMKKIVCVCCEIPFVDSHAGTFSGFRCSIYERHLHTLTHILTSAYIRILYTAFELEIILIILIYI